jgi:hypothetical protein
MRYMKNEHILAHDAIDDEVLTDGKTAQTGAEVVADATNIRMVGNKEKAVSNEPNEAMAISMLSLSRAM